MRPCCTMRIIQVMLSIGIIYFAFVVTYFEKFCVNRKVL